MIRGEETTKTTWRGQHNSWRNSQTRDRKIVTIFFGYLKEGKGRSQKRSEESAETSLRSFIEKIDTTPSQSPYARIGSAVGSSVSLP